MTQSTPQHTLVLGLAKTGTTFIAEAVRDSAARPAPRLIFEPRTRAKLLERPHAPRLAKVLFDHWKDDLAALSAIVERDDAAGFATCVCILRDPRDQAVSRLLYWPYNLLWRGAATLSDIDAWGRELERKEAAPRAVSFDDLYARFSAIFRVEALAAFRYSAAMQLRYLDFLEGLRRDVVRIRYEDAVGGDFSALAATLGAVSHDQRRPRRYAHTLRSGGSGDWRRLLTAADLDAVRALMEEACARSGYDDWSLDADPHLPADAYSGYARALGAAFLRQGGPLRVRLKRWFGPRG